MLAAWFRVAILLFALGMTSPCLSADDADIVIDADLQKILQAVKTHRVETIADMMYTPFVDAAGGLDTLKAQAVKAQADAVAKDSRL